MVTYDKENVTVSRLMGRINHEFNDIVVESIHRHLAGKFCIDIFVAEGSRERIRELLRRIRGIHGVYIVKHVFIPMD